MLGGPRQNTGRADLGLYLPGRPRVNTPSRQPLTILKHCPTTSTSDTIRGQTQQVPERRWSNSYSVGWAPAQPILHGGHWSQPVLAAVRSRDKLFPLMCQQQSRLNYNRRVYKPLQGVGGMCPSSAQPGWLGGCATGPYRTPSTLGHTSKPGRCSSSTDT